VVIQPGSGFFRLNLRALWEHRELLYFFVWRDTKVRYKQTVLGVAWAVLQPLLTTAVFTVVFGHFARLPSDGAPYVLFAYSALLPWTYFASALGRSSVSLVAGSHLITKVYFPRLTIPIAAALTPLIDCVPATAVLLVLMAFYGVAPGWGLLAVPPLLGMALVTALAVSFWLAPLNVRYRDVAHTLPFLTHLWMYASPIAYPVSLVPERWQLLYSLNPMVGVIEGFRWAVLGTGRLDVLATSLSAITVLLLFVCGAMYFGRAESSLADVV
jgi:lipopolysaccharide transport system permease protein